MIAGELSIHAPPPRSSASRVLSASRRGLPRPHHVINNDTRMLAAIVPPGSAT